MGRRGTDSGAGCSGLRIRPSSRARAVASVRLAAPSLLSTWVTCFLTVGVTPPARGLSAGSAYRPLAAAALLSRAGSAARPGRGDGRALGRVPLYHCGVLIEGAPVRPAAARLCHPRRHPAALPRNLRSHHQRHKHHHRDPQPPRLLTRPAPVRPPCRHRRPGCKAVTSASSSANRRHDSLHENPR